MNALLYINIINLLFFIFKAFGMMEDIISIKTDMISTEENMINSLITFLEKIGMQKINAIKMN